MLHHSTYKAGLPLAAALSLAAFSAQGADLYKGTSLKDAPVYAPVNSWTGFYFGANGGYGWSANGKALETTTDYFAAASCAECIPPISDLTGGTLVSRFSKLAPEGGFGGGQFGYNSQHGNVVFGFEIDAQASGMKDSFHTALDAGRTVGFVSVGAQSSLEWFGTLRGRVGYTFDRGLIYATGGFAVGGVRDSIFASAPDFADSPSFNFSKDEARTGFAVGAGVEYLIMPSWSLKAEYQYMDLGSSRIKGTVTGGVGVPGDFLVYGANISTNKIDHTYNMVRAGLNYHINQGYEPLK